MTIANLPMYDLPEIRHATDDWWSGLARAFRRAGISDVPDRLDRERAMPEVWRDPGPGAKSFRPARLTRSSTSIRS